MLNAILEREDLKVVTAQTQKAMPGVNLGVRDARIDTYAEDAAGKHYDIEIQRGRKGADIKRARYYSAVLDARLLKPKQDFKDMMDSFVIFITDEDALEGGQPLYFFDRYCANMQMYVRDGNHIIYVNGAYRNDDSEIGKLMRDFRCSDPEDMHSEVLRKSVEHFKKSEGGRGKMMTVMDQYAAEIRKEGIAEGKAAGKAEGMYEARICKP